jgi:hypothetical protein
MGPVVTPPKLQAYPGCESRNRLSSPSDDHPQGSAKATRNPMHPSWYWRSIW